MKKLIILIALISAPALAEDYEPSIGAYVTSITNTDDDNSAPAAVMASLWYVKYDFNVGVEVLGSQDTSGVFAVGRYAIDNQWNIGTGIGKVGYEVNDSYKKPTALMLFTDYQTDYGKIIARFIVSESNSDYYTIGECTHTNAPPDNHLDSCITSQSETTNIQQMILIGFQYDL